MESEKEELHLVVLVTGDRNWSSTDVVVDVLSEFPEGTILRHGAARGADTICSEAGKLLGFIDDPMPYMKELGRAGGPVRNLAMADKSPNVSCVRAFHDDIANSKGTKHMLSVCMKRGIPFKLFNSLGEEVHVMPEMLKPAPKAKKPKTAKVAR